METKSNDFPITHKIVTVISLIISLVVLVLALLQLFDVWDRAVDLFCPLLGVNMLCQAYIQWKSNRKVAYFNIGAAAFIFICAIIVFFV